MRTYIKSELQSEYLIIEASDGSEGFEKALEHSPELIISDVMMPGINGIEFCTNIKNNELTSHIPVILLTAKTGEESTIEGYTSGADDYITKPFSAPVLKSRIKNILHNREKLRKIFTKAIYVNPKEITVNKIDEKFMIKVFGSIEKNLDNPDFSVVMLASETNTSRTLLFQKIKAITGETVNDFIVSMRIKKAADLLTHSSLGIAEIAYKVGFNNPKYFAKCFKEIFDKTPSQYRNI